MTPRLPDMEDDSGEAEDIAIAWFSRERSGEMTAQEGADLQAWLEADSAHAEAYAAVSETWVDVGLVREDPQVMAMRERWRASEQERRRRVVLRGIAASVMAAVLGGGALAGWQYATGPRPLADRTFQTALGEQSVVTLPDGSEVTLNTNTVLRTRAAEGKRLVYLERGQAFFEVAKDAGRPFVVTAAGRTVTALGTAFDVRLDEGAFKVTLVEGKVRVEAVAAKATPGGAGPRSMKVQATEMVAGSQLVAPDDEHWRLTPANVLNETSWTRGQLVFENRPLGEVVEELNRYSARKMIIADASLNTLPVSGTFKVGDVDRFIHALEAYHFARRGRSTDVSVQLHAYPEGA